MEDGKSKEVIIIIVKPVVKESVFIDGCKFLGVET